MHLSTVLIVAALVASGVALLFASQRLVAVVALVVSGVEVAMHLGVLRMYSGRFSLGTVLGVALVVCGAILWVSAGRKVAVSAATVIALVGLAQVLALLLP